MKLWRKSRCRAVRRSSTPGQAHCCCVMPMASRCLTCSRNAPWPPWKSLRSSTWCGAQTPATWLCWLNTVSGWDEYLQIWPTNIQTWKFSLLVLKGSSKSDFSLFFFFPSLQQLWSATVNWKVCATFTRTSEWRVEPGMRAESLSTPLPTTSNTPSRLGMCCLEKAVLIYSHRHKSLGTETS